MNKLTPGKRKQVIAALTEGMGVNPVCRITGVVKNTVLKLLAQLGEVCDEFQDKTVRGLRCERIQCDENWASPRRNRVTNGLDTSDARDTLALEIVGGCG